MRQRFQRLIILVFIIALLGVMGTYAVATTPPMPPPQLSISESGITATSIPLSWTASVYALNYLIYRKTLNGDYAIVGSVGGAATSYTDNGLKNGHYYTYMILAQNQFGTVSSNELSACTVMPAPTDLRATAEGTSIQLTWKDNCNSEDKWGVRYIGPEGMDEYKSIVSTTSEQVGGTVTYTLSNFEIGQTYTFWVYSSKFLSGYGESYSTFSDKATVTVPIPGGGGAVVSPGQVEITFYVGNTMYLVDGDAATMDAPPIILESRTLLPIRYVAEPLGATVKWDAAAQKVTISLGEKLIELWIGNNAATVNGKNVFVDSTNPKVTPLILPPGRTMLPLRFIAENLGCQVDWNGATNTAKITYPKP